MYHKVNEWILQIHYDRAKLSIDCNLYINNIFLDQIFYVPEAKACLYIVGLDMTQVGWLRLMVFIINFINYFSSFFPIIFC